MKRVLLYLGMGSCISSSKDHKSNGPNSCMGIVDWSSVSTKTNVQPNSVLMGTQISVQNPVSDSPGIKDKDEMFFDSKPWLDSDDEDFLSVYEDASPTVNQANMSYNGDQQGRKLGELFQDSSFGSESQTSHNANAEANKNNNNNMMMISRSNNKNDKKSANIKIEKKKSANKLCLPSLVRSLSCGDRKKRLSPVEVIG